MRIMLLTHSYWPESTPPQRRWTAFTAVFREHGWNVDVVAPRAPRITAGRSGKWRTSLARWNASGPAGETIRSIPFLGGNASRSGRLLGHCLAAAMSVPRAMVAPRPDLVIVTVPSLPHLVAGWVVAKLHRRPLVVEMRDAWPDLAHDSKVANPRVTALLDAVMTFIQRRANLVVTVTGGFRKQLKARGVDHVVTVHNGISAGRLPAVAHRLAHDGPLRVLYMGNHGESQGLEAVVRAVALAGDSVSARFVGTGTVKPRLVELADRLGASIDFRTVVHGQNLAQHYQWADTCVVSLRGDWPSFAWTVPSKTYELLATGRHITAILRGEAARIIETTGSGHVVEWDAATIADLWRQLGERRELLEVGASGREWVLEHADMRELAVRYMGYLTELVQL